MSEAAIDFNEECASKLKILSNSSRLRIFSFLIEVGPQSVTELEKAISIEQSLLSHHLKTLRNAGLVICRKVGRSCIYEASDAVQRSGSGNEIDLGCCSIMVPRTN